MKQIVESDMITGFDCLFVTTNSGQIHGNELIPGHYVTRDLTLARKILLVT